MMSLITICLLSVLLTAVSSQGEKSQSAGCQYYLQAQKSIKANPMLRTENATNLDSCLRQCANYNRVTGESGQKCNNVGYSSLTSGCLMYSLSPDEVKNMLYDLAHMTTATDVQCVPEPADGTPSPGVNTPPPATAAPPVSSPSYTGCGKQDSEYLPELANSLRVVGGRIAKANSWPWMMKFQNGCGASLIPVRDGLDSSDMVLTAGHCFPPPAANFDYTRMIIHAGKHELDKEEATQVMRQVAAVKFNNEADPKSNDIALVRLNEAIKFTNTIRPVCLPSANDPLPLNKQCFATGWGSTKADDLRAYSNQLKQAKLDARPDDECRNAWGITFVSPKHFCAGDGVTTLCSGDSGGPLMCQTGDEPWVQYGINSFVINNTNTCTDGRSPAMFTRIQVYADWIQTSIKEMSTLAQK